jgi:hypothetical protein
LNKCSAITQSGAACKALPIRGEQYCRGHHPAYAQARRIHGAKGGKRGGRGRPLAELSDIKRRLSELAEGVLEGSVERGTGAVVSQILNVYLRAVSVELKVREVTELEARIEALERAQDEQRGAKTWQRA